MGKRFVLCIFFGLVFPILTFAQGEDALLLSEKDTKIILNALQGEVSKLGSTIEIFDYSSQQQAALTLFRSSSRETILKFLPGFAGTETIKTVINVASSLQKSSEMTMKKILEEIEKQTVEKAIEIGTDWLLQNEIKTGSGSIESTYWNYNNNQVKANFQYILTYQSRGSDNGLVVLKFYSADQVDVPRATISTGGSFGFIGDSPYIGTVRPFIIQIETTVERYALGWAVDSSADTKITVEFPEKVPRLQLAKEWPYPLEEQKINLLNTWTTAKKILEYLRATGSEAFGKTADFAHKAQEVVESFINRASQLLSKSGAGLISPADNESQQLDEIKAQLNLVKEILVDETKPGLVENKFDPVKVRQEILDLKGILNQVKNEIEQEEILKQALVVKLNQVKQNDLLDLVKQEVKQEAIDLVKEEVKEDEAKLNSIKGIKDIAEEKPAVWCAIDPTRGPALNSVVLSEIAWMGSANSANDEWMKLKNISNGEVSIAGWQLQDKDNQIQLALGKEHVMPAQGIFILERTNDDSLPGTSAHSIYTGALNNTNEALYLFDEKCVLRDKVVASPDWPAGNSASRKPMVRDNDLSWYTQGGGGSFLNTESIPVASSPPPTYPKILISEVQTAGLSSETEEFVEMYNPTNGQVDLTDWYVQKKTQGTDSFSTFASKNILSGKTIQAQGYFLIAREGSSFAASADVITSYSLGDNNTLVIKNPNGEIADRVGWGDVQDAENTPAPNPQAGKSLNRIWDTTNQTYYDRDNNSIDFVVRNPTSPKVKNIENDTTAPQVALSTLATSQSDVSFSLAWTATDSGGETSPSGVQSIFVEYTVTPSATGVFARYNNNGVWTNWQSGSTGKIPLNAQTTSLSIRAQDGVSYTFQVSASDVAGNPSAVASASTAVTLSKTVVINEIAWMGTIAAANDEWIELYNTTANPIDLTGWILASDDGTPSIQLAGTIGAGAYFLLERTADTTISDVLANQIYTAGALANEGEYLKLSDASGSLVDSVNASASWFSIGGNTTKQSMERVSVSQSGSSASNWAKNNTIQHNGKDAGTAMYYSSPGNFINGTPKQANSTVTSPTTIEANIGGLRFEEFDTITLTLLGSPYITTAGVISITIPAGKTLIVEPGVTVKFADSRGRLTVQGTLKAQGTQENQITFTVDAGAVWCGVNFASTSTSSQLEYVTIDKAVSITGSYCTAFFKYSMYVDSSIVTMRNSVIQNGNTYRTLYLKNSNSTIDAVTVSGADLNPDSVALYIDGGSPTISNSTISNNSIGILVNGLANNPTIQNNTFTGNAKAVKLESAGAVLSGNVASSNTYNGIFVEGVTQADMVWQKDSIPYIINQFTVSPGTTLTIQAGVVVKFIILGYRNPEFIVNGALVTQGTAANPVVFTAVSDNTVGGSDTFSGVGGVTGATSWKRIYIAPGSTGSQLTYTTLKYGGNTYYEAALYVKQSDVQLSNVTISNSERSAIASVSGTITGSGVTLSDNTYGFHIQSESCPTLTNVTITGGVILHPDYWVVCSFP